jgi:alpha-tubulin suppressor-like RCC1 family protein
MALDPDLIPIDVRRYLSRDAGFKVRIDTSRRRMSSASAPMTLGPGTTTSAVGMGGGYDVHLIVNDDGELWGAGYLPGFEFKYYYSDDPSDYWVDNVYHVPSLYTSEIWVYPWIYLDISDVKDTACTISNIAVVKTDGTVWVRGDGEDSTGGGSLGLGSGVENSTTYNDTVVDEEDYEWVQIPGLSNIVRIDGHDRYYMALDDQGNLWQWGTVPLTTLPTQLDTPTIAHGLTDVVKFSCGYTHAAAIRSDGTLAAWGVDANGSTGTGQAGQSVTVTPIAQDVSEVACGDFHTAFIKDDGTLWIAGDYANMANGPNHVTPEQVQGLSGLKRVAAGEETTFVINASNQVLSAGYQGSVGALGWDGPAAGAFTYGAGGKTETFHNVTIDGSPVEANAIFASGKTGMLINSECDVYLWGNNGGYDQSYLGIVNNIDEGIVEPTKPITHFEWNHPEIPGNVIDVDAYQQSNSITVLNDQGQVFMSSYSHPEAPSILNGIEGWYAILGTVPGAVQVRSASNGAYVLKNDGTVWFKGNRIIQYPNTWQNAADFVQLDGPGNIVEMSNVGEDHMLLKSDTGAIYVTGNCASLAMGTGVTRYVTSEGETTAKQATADVVPLTGLGSADTQVSGDTICTTRWTSLVQNGGAVYAWGLVNFGESMQGSSPYMESIDPPYFSESNVMTIVKPLNGFSPTSDVIAGGGVSSWALSGSTAKMFGNNRQGEGGKGSHDLLVHSVQTNGPVTAKVKPSTTQDHDFTGAEFAAATYFSVYVRKADGSIWTWGSTDWPRTTDTTLDGIYDYEHSTSEQAGPDGYFVGWPAEAPALAQFDKFVCERAYGGVGIKNGTAYGWGGEWIVGRGDYGEYAPSPVELTLMPNIAEGNITYLTACARHANDPTVDRDDDDGGGGGDEGEGGGNEPEWPPTETPFPGDGFDPERPPFPDPNNPTVPTDPDDPDVPTDPNDPDWPDDPPFPPVPPPFPPPPGGDPLPPVTDEPWQPPDGQFPTGPNLPPTPDFRVPLPPDIDGEPPFLPGDPVFPEFPDPVYPGYPEPPNYGGEIGGIDIPDWGFDPCLDLGDMDFDFDPCAGSDGGGGGGTGGPGAGEGLPVPGEIVVDVEPPYDPDARFDAKWCKIDYPVMDAITELCEMVGVDPAQVTFEEDCDKTFTKCFDIDSKIFDAIWWLADYCGFEAFDPGDGGIEITPPTPLDVIWIHNEFIDLVEFSRNYDSIDVVPGVEVFRMETIRRGRVAVPAFTWYEPVDTVFDVSGKDPLRIQAPDNWTNQQIIDEAVNQAARMKTGLTVTIGTPLNTQARYRHQILVQKPSKGYYALFMIGKTVHSINASEGNLSIHECKWIGAANPDTGFQMGMPLNNNGMPALEGGSTPSPVQEAWPSQMGIGVVT